MTSSAAATRATWSSGASWPARPAARSSTSAAGPAASPSTSPATGTGSRASTSTRRWSPLSTSARGRRPPGRGSVGDAREFALDGEFALVMAPMQLIQVLAGPAERLACLRCAARHLRPGGRRRGRDRRRLPGRADRRGPASPARRPRGRRLGLLQPAAGRGARLGLDRRPPPAPDRLARRRAQRRARRDPPAPAAGGDGRGGGARGGARAGRPPEVPPTDAHVGSTVLLLEAR